MEMCERIQKLWRDFIGDDSEHRLMVLDASIELSVINVEAKSEIRSMGESQYSVRFYENCGHSPAWPLVPRAMIDLEDRGFDFQPHVLPMWNDPCMAAISDDGSPMGFLIYRYDEVNCSWFVMLAYVVPEHRRTGVHTALFSALVDRAKQRGDILSIYCGTHVNNTAAQAAFEAQGRAKKAIMYSFHLKDWADGKEPTEVAQ
ncbi:GNAT family N-acetyltransferase [Sinorhizobium medicae]|uniref:GNAT family N-acetyltransferase n=1 Tax=Sinorhizobium medicae TaxID=110321 RepID=UPI00399ADF91